MTYIIRGVTMFIQRLVKITILMSFLTLLFFLVISGGVWVYKYPDIQRERILWAKTITLWNEERIKLEKANMRIQSLESFIRWEKILSEVLSPQEQLELDVLEERLRQKIQEENLLRERRSLNGGVKCYSTVL